MWTVLTRTRSPFQAGFLSRIISFTHKTTTMKFKINKGTQLFEKLTAIHAKMKACSIAAKAIANKYGWETWWQSSYCAAGGISGIQLPEKPDGWKLASPRQSRSMFYPKIIRQNKALLAELDALPVVKVEEISITLKYGLQIGPNLQISRCPGVVWFDDYILIDSPDWLDWKPEGGEEILTSEYNELKEKKIN